MTKIPPAPEPRPTRRGFFQALVKKALQPIAQAVDERLAAVQQATAPFRRFEAPPAKTGATGAPPQSEPFVPFPARRDVLRPPGAQAEPEFLEHCQRCGHCVEACPVQAIMPLCSTDEQLHHTPYINPEKKACATCNPPACMEACPSGALMKMPITDVHMGLAVVDPKACTRSQGKDCRICVDACPLGEQALGLEDGWVRVRDPGCIGCGLCQERCPSEPTAIRVAPW